jgi:hypothetical protein
MVRHAKIRFGHGLSPDIITDSLSSHFRWPSRGRALVFWFNGRQSDAKSFSLDATQKISINT